MIYSVLPITTEELEGILSKGETSIVEFKQQHAWDALLFAKDILAFSNTRNGGYIIVGVEDKSHARQGVTPEQQASYNIDIMKDQISKYADPFVNFSVEFPKDNHGLIYVAISIFQFEQIPVICKISDQRAGVFAGVIYHRNSNRRPESAAVSNSYDMRTIIQMSTLQVKPTDLTRSTMMTANSERIQKFLQEIAHGPRPASTLRVWIALYPYIDTKTGRIQCSQRALAKTSNVHFGDVNRSLKRLVNIGTLVKKDKGAYFLSPSVLDENGIYDRGFKWP